MVRATIGNQVTNLASRPCVHNTARLLLVLLWVLAVFSWQVAQGVLVPCDRAVAGWIAAGRFSSWDQAVRAITFFGGSVWAVAALGALGVWTWRRRGLGAATAWIGAFGLGLVIEVALRLLVAQWRPDTLMLPPAMDWHTRFELAGFPSGHAYRSAFIFGWLMAETNRARWAAAIRWTSLVMIVFVGVSRLYLNRHWASDVLGSWLIAAVALVVVQGRAK